ncbi:hypothetical protein N3K66_000588 [Trichothecium roseum]|uniref:Uncharacterized protein n=1 Tax=Trichothecium roseum TaxID=47278 RepID=A0ACC0VCC3_9HYPO|nr:hypothetical protein N3K66_000588 [Trichothecium roseum]
MSVRATISSVQMRALLRPVLSSRQRSFAPPLRQFSTSGAREQAKNQILDEIRNTDQFHTYLAVSSSSRVPLVTFWTAGWCPSCRQISPLLTSLVESGVGEAEGSIMYAQLSFDAPDTASLGSTYMISSIPTLLSFDAGEAQTQTKVADVRKMADRQFLVEWIKEEARRQGTRGGGGGGGGGGSAFGGLFGSWKS